MGLMPTACPAENSSAPRPERRVLMVFVPAENLRRVCVVPLEMLAGMLLLLGLAARARAAAAASGGETDQQQQQREGAVSGDEESKEGQTPPEQSSSAASSVLAEQDDSEQRPGTASPERAREDATQGSGADLQQERCLGSSRQISVIGDGVEETPESSPNVSIRHVNQDHDSVTDCTTPSLHQDEAADQDVNSGSSELQLDERETLREYGPFWPCSAHPPNQPRSFLDLTEEEQDEIMEADLEAYRKAWRPGDMKRILWNPDPDLADEDQGMEAFHDENYEFFWWTPTAYRCTREKHVFYPGNVTEYPVHRPEYCPVCDRHVLETLPQRGKRLSSSQQFVPEQPTLGQRDYQREVPPDHSRTLGETTLPQTASEDSAAKYIEDEAVRTDQVRPGNLELQYSDIHEIKSTGRCDLETVEVSYSSNKTAAANMCAIQELEKTCQERSADVDCLERKLLELLKNTGDGEYVISIDYRTASGAPHNVADSLYYEGYANRNFNDTNSIELAVDTHRCREQSEFVEHASLPCQRPHQVQAVNSEIPRAVSTEVVPSSEGHQEAVSTKEAQTHKSSTRKRRNRRSRKQGQVRTDGVAPSSVRSDYCGCKCETCRACKGSSSVCSAQVKCEPERSEDTEASLPLLAGSEDVASGNACDVKEFRERQSAGEALSCINLPHEIAAISGETESGTTSSAVNNYINISFGDCEPERIYRPMRRPASLSFRPSYEPQDRVTILGMDFVLGDGCIDRLVANGLTLDDFIVTEGTGRHEKKMFLWPGSPTKPCIDLVGQKIYASDFNVHALSVTHQEPSSSRNEERRDTRVAEDAGTGEHQPARSQNGDSRESEKGYIKPDCDNQKNGANGDRKEITRSGKRNHSGEAGAVALASSKESQEDTTDVEPASPHSSEGRKKSRTRPKKRFRWTNKKIWKKKEPSTDPSSPYSTFGSGSPSSDEDGQKKPQLSRTQSSNMVSVGQPRVVRNAGKTGQEHASAGENGHPIHHSGDLDYESVEAQLIHKLKRMEIRRYMREVRRAKRAAHHLRLVRRSYLHTAKALWALKSARQKYLRRTARKNVRDKARSANGAHAKAGENQTAPGQTARGSRRMPASKIGSASPPPSLERPVFATCDSQAHHAKVSVNNGNIADIYNAVKRMAGGDSVREVEVELQPKQSPAPATPKKLRRVNVECRPEAGNENDVQLSPHSMSDGLWNGRRPGDPSEIVRSSLDLEAQELAKPADEQPDEAREDESQSSSSISDTLSFPDVFEEVDYVRDFEESELGKLITFGDELDKIEQEVSTNITESRTSEEPENERTGRGTREDPVAEDSGSSVSAGVQRRLPRRVASPMLDDLTWDPTWMRSPPLSPRSRLHAIFSRLPTSPDSMRTSPELLPGASAAAADPEPAEGGQLVPWPLRDRETERSAQNLGLQPAMLITSVHQQPEDNQLSHGDSAQPWVRRHSSADVRTLADLITRRQARPVPVNRGAVRMPLPWYPHASFSI